MGFDLGQFVKGIYRPKKIGVCTAWGSPFVWTHPAFNMMNWIRPPGVEVRFFPGFGRDPAARHSWGVENALVWGATHIMFFGADQVCDVDVLIKFCRHAENGWPMVTGITPARGLVDMQGNGDKVPFAKCAWKARDNGNGKVVERKLTPEYLVPIDPKDGDLQECLVIGSGALMFDVNLLKMLKKPWFREMEPDMESFRKAAMDTYFCWRLITEAGGKMLADLSIEILHLDVFPIDGTFSERFKDWTGKKDYKYPDKRWQPGDKSTVPAEL